MGKITKISAVLMLMLPLTIKSIDCTTVFAHGLGGDSSQGNYYHVASGIHYACIEGKLVTFNFTDAGNPTTSCLGQDADISALHKVCKDLENVILFGCSRGAATIANYLGTHQLQNISAAILESPFDRVDSIVKKLNGQESIPLITPAMYPNYDPKGIAPIDVADKISHSIPILLIASKQDALIDYTSTVNLYNKIVASGHPHAYLLVTERGRHANILFDRDGNSVRSVIHAFYKAHNLPHNATWAREGQTRFEQCKNKK